MKIQQIGGVPITRSRPFLILEAGVNHEGSLDTALEMIDAAAEAGADMIKFQSYKAETLASKNSPAYWDRNKEPTPSQFELFKKHDAFVDEDYKRLAQRCEEKGILFCSTPFDSHFVDFLEPLMPVYKIASADITNVPLLRQVAAKGKPILLSTGASYLSEVEEALRTCEEAGAQEIALLHCVLEYPTLPEHVNLATIAYLKSVFPNYTTGWSDHIPPKYGCLALIAAWVEGADILEKHYTLDKSLPGNDHYHGMDPDDVREFRRILEYAQSIVGDYGKRVFPWEESARKFARRSLVATCDIPAGATLTPEMITQKRPGTGISPKHYDRLMGRKTAVAIQEDDILQWEHFMLAGDDAAAD